MTDCKGDDLRGSDATIRAHQRGQYAGRESGQEYFAGNFLNTLLLGQALNLFDFLVIDLLWWRHTKRVRFSGTEECPELYADPRKHFYAFLRGVLLFLAVALINWYLLTWI